AEHRQRRVSPQAQHFRMADAGLLADADGNAGVGVLAVDGGNILLVQVDAGGCLGRHRHAGECEWRQGHQRQGTLLGVGHSLGLPISSTRISQTNGRPECRLPLFSNGCTAAPRGWCTLAAVLGPATSGTSRSATRWWPVPPQLLAARISFNKS